MIGQVVSHFRIESKLGEGSMGVVYKARDTPLDRLVAIKILSAAAAERKFPPQNVACVHSFDLTNKLD